jgi:hypothetical protein
MKIAMTRAELMPSRLSPPRADGSVRRSPNVAPSGRVRGAFSVCDTSDGVAEMLNFA